MKIGKSGDAVLLILLLLLLAGVSFWAVSGSETGEAASGSPRRAAASPRPGGYKALYLLLSESDLSARRVETPPERWPAEVSLMIAADSWRENGPGPFPSLNDWTQKQAAAALRQIESGKTLVLLMSDDNPLTRRLGLKIITRSTERPGQDFAPAQPAEFFTDISKIRLAQRARFLQTPPGAVTLLGDAKSPAAVLWPRGSGWIVAISDAAFADNQHLALADNARFLRQLLENRAGPNGTIGFDEYHQGYQRDRSLWSAIGSSGRWALAQILLVVFLLCWSAARRFGVPRPLPPSERLSSEYVAAVADLYRRAGAVDAAAATLLHTLRRDLGRALGLPADAEVDELAAEAQFFGQEKAARLRETLQSGERLAAARIAATRIAHNRRAGEKELVQFARQAEMLRKEFGIGTDAAE